MTVNKVQCQICKKYFKEITNTHVKRHNISLQRYMKLFPEYPIRSVEANHLRRIALKGRKLSEEHKQKLRKPKSQHMREALKKAHARGDFDFLKGRKPWNKGLTKDDHPSIKRTAEKLMGHPGLKGDKNPMKRPEVRQKFSKIRRELLKNDEWVKKWMKSFHRSPNKVEKRLIEIIEKYNLPYKFVGNGEFILGGKNPDFINVNGEKKLIEIFGIYWHRNDDPQDRIDFFKQYGFDTIVFWETELQNEQEVVNRIIALDKKENG